MQTFRDAIETGDAQAVGDVLAEDVVFQTPTGFRPHYGRERVAAILFAISGVLEDFHYTREITDRAGSSQALLFRARIGDLELEGCDFLQLNSEGQIGEFTVMIRPLSAALALAEAMKEQLQQASAS